MEEWDANIDRFNVTINENTCRPYYYVREEVTWLDELSNILDTSLPILSLDKNFSNFVDQYRRYLIVMNIYYMFIVGFV